MSEESKKCGGGFKWFVIIIVLLNTFFLGSIWCMMKCSIGCGYGKKAFCPFSQKSGKICPLTGKSLQSSLPSGSDQGSVKGSN